MLTCVEQPKRYEPRFVQIHSSILIRGDAFDSGIHEAHELMGGERFAGAGDEVVFIVLSGLLVVRVSVNLATP